MKHLVPTAVGVALAFVIASTSPTMAQGSSVFSMPGADAVNRFGHLLKRGYSRLGFRFEGAGEMATDLLEDPTVLHDVPRPSCCWGVLCPVPGPWPPQPPCPSPPMLDIPDAATQAETSGPSRDGGIDWERVLNCMRECKAEKKCDELSSEGEGEKSATPDGGDAPPDRETCIAECEDICAPAKPGA